MIKSIGKLILDLSDFSLLVTKTQHICNRRPVAFKDAVAVADDEIQVPEPITPEMLVYGRELLSLNVIPQLNVPLEDLINTSFQQDWASLQKANARLVDCYSTEFMARLAYQAIDKRDRYQPVLHKTLSVGDVVLLVEANTKRSNYPLGIVREVFSNALGEVTSAVVVKGKTREKVFRHSTSLIRLLSSRCDTQIPVAEDVSQNGEGLPTVARSSIPSEEGLSPPASRPTRAASKAAKRLIAQQFSNSLL